MARLRFLSRWICDRQRNFVWTASISRSDVAYKFSVTCLPNNRLEADAREARAAEPER